MNEEEYFAKLEELDPLLARIRKMYSRCPSDVSDALFEIWENLMLARDWCQERVVGERATDELKGIITVHVTRKTLSVDKN